MDGCLLYLKKVKTDIARTCETRQALEVSAKWRSEEEIFLSKATENKSENGGVGFIVKEKVTSLIKG